VQFLLRKHDMRILAAMTVWNHRVAPVFDVASRVVLIEPTAGDIVGELDLPECSPTERAARLEEAGVRTLVCGAISQVAATAIVAAGIRLLSCVAGDLDEVIAALQSGALDRHALRLPPCPCCCGGRRRRQRGHR